MCFNQHLLPFLFIPKYLSNPAISQELSCHHVSPSSPHFSLGLLSLYFDSLLSLLFSPFFSLQNCTVTLHSSQVLKIAFSSSLGLLLSDHAQFLALFYKAVDGTASSYLSRLDYCLPSLFTFHCIFLEISTFFQVQRNHVLFYPSLWNSILSSWEVLCPITYTLCVSLY